MWFCKNCDAEFNKPNTGEMTMNGYLIPVAVCPFCGSDDISTDDENLFDFDVVYKEE